MDNRISQDIDIDPVLEKSYSGSTGSRTMSELGGRDFPAWLWLLWEERALVRKAFVYTLLLGLIIAFVIPSQYRSRTRIMPPDDSQGAAMMASFLAKSGSAGGGLGDLAGTFLGMKTSGALYAALLQSRTVQDHIVERFELQKVYWKRYRDEAIKKLDSRTDIEEDRKSGIISIAVTDNSRERARALTAAYVEELDKLLAQVSTSAARRQREFIEKRLAAVQNDLESAERDLSAFSSKTSLLDVKEQTKAMVESVAMLQAQLMAAQAQLEGLEQIYTNENVRVRSTKAQIAELRNQLYKLGGLDQASDSKAGSDELYPPLRKLPALGVTWTDLYRRAKVQEALFELLTKQYELARLEEAKEIPTIKVIDRANLPERRSFPPRTLIICLITLAGMLGTIGFILVVPQWEQLPANNAMKLIFVEVKQKIVSRLSHYNPNRA